MQVETDRDPKVVLSPWEEFVIPGVCETTLKGLRAKFPDLGILELEEDTSLTVPVRLAPKGLATCSDGSVDAARYGAKIDREKRGNGRMGGVAGYQHVRWLLRIRPQVLLELLRSGFCLEFPGTVIVVSRKTPGRGGKHGTVQRQKLIRLMPRIHNGSNLKMTWGFLGAGDLDPRTRVAFASPIV